MDLHDQVLSAIRAYEASKDSRAVFPDPAALGALDFLPVELPKRGLPESTIVTMLEEWVGPATVVSNGGRYFGFVTGGALPAATAANMLAASWDQNTALTVMSPGAVRLERMALEWVRQLLRLPEGAEGTFVTGATMANFIGILAARHSLLQRLGWDVGAKGLFGAPEFSVVVGEEAHVTLMKALMMAGLGAERVIRVPADGQGRMDPARFPELEAPALVCLQAGNVNSGALDSTELVGRAKASGSWVHVDGAFGLWHPQAEYGGADSWATDAHKWLNVPYDSGIGFVRSREDLMSALSVTASYLNSDGGVEPMHKSPESSRRARGIDAWAALVNLGKHGVAEMVERCCRHARRFSEGLAGAGVAILNEVTLNQVVASLDTDEETSAWIERVQADGVCWAGSTFWRDRRAMRISVSSYATTQEDVERSLESMIRCRG